ncbi:MAG: M23 family metallopeptidase, partial [Clostridia bacterium]|nr:M23 family metallopeptidase [Clostridia bacterium]
DGCVITINHSDGFVSVYSSLEEDALVAQGDKVSKGQLIGKAAATATNESLSGGHLHFQLFKDGKEVDPNNYLDLQNK